MSISAHTPNAAPHAAARPQRRSLWIPWTFVGAFLVVVAVNATMITLAIDTRVDLVTAEPYRRGVAYQRLLDEARRVEALGWTAAIAVAPAGPQAAMVTVEARIGDRMMTGAEAEIRASRPIEGDAVAPVRVPVVSGRAEAVIAGLRPGQWSVEVVLMQGGEAVRFVERAVLR